tara:strand:- start:1278 stop:2063 length:786 start_codon:yes stop_codon:yes gene_type:complete
MDDLVSLMQIIDLNSEILSEGDYLKMCNHMKNIHVVLNNKYETTDSETDDFYTNRLDLPLPPFSPVPRLPPLPSESDENDTTLYDSVSPLPLNPGEFIQVNIDPIRVPDNIYSSSDDDSETVYDPDSEINTRLEVDRDNWSHMNINEIEYVYYETTSKIEELYKKMRGLKHRKNITSTVRKEAVRKAARELGITLRRYTIGALLDAGHNVGDEKTFYKSYINDYNEEIDRIKEETNNDIVYNQYKENELSNLLFQMGWPNF